MKEFFTPETIQIIETMVIIPIILILARIAIQYLNILSTKLQKQLENETLSNYVLLAEDTIETVVVSVMQTYVDSLKKKGAFGKEQQLEAKHKALEQIKELLTDATLEALEMSFADVNIWIDTKLEMYVEQNKDLPKIMEVK